MSKHSNLNKYKSRSKKTFSGVGSENVNHNEKVFDSVKKEKGNKYKMSFASKYSRYFPWVILVVVVVLFSNSVGNDFLNWDDDRYVTGNANLQLTWSNIKYYFFHFYFVMYIPLTMLSYMIDVFFGGGDLNPQIFHAHNLFLHILNTMLVYFFTKKLFEDKGDLSYIFAIFSSLLFGVHSIHTESVVWIAERKDVLYTFFFFSSILSYLYYLSTHRKKFLLLSFLLFFVSLLAKTQAVVLPLVLIVIDYYKIDFLGDKDKLRGFLFLRDKRQWKIFFQKVPFLLLSVVFGYIAIKASGTNEPFAESISPNTRVAVSTGYNFLESIMLMSYSLFLYVAETILPFNQSAIHPYPFNVGEMPGYFYFFSLFSIAFFVILVYSWIKRKKLIFFSLMFFLFNIFIVLRIKNFIISEHYLYIPSIGIGFILIFLGLSIVRRYSHLKSVILSLSLIYFIFLGVKTYQRNDVFENSLTFWNDVTSKYAQVVVGYYNRGNYYQKEGDDIISSNKLAGIEFYELAIEDYSKTVELHPTDVGAYSNRGITLAKIGKIEEAIFDFNKVVGIDSTYGNVYSNRGNAFALQGKWAEAIADYNRSISLNPNLSDAFYNRAIAYFNINRYDDAIKDFDRVLEFSGTKYEALRQRAISYYFSGRYERAIFDINSCLEFVPEDGFLIYYKALSYDRLNFLDSAEQQYNNLRDNFPGIVDNIVKTSISYENSADYSQNSEFYDTALDYLRSALKIDSRNSVVYMRMGVLYGKKQDLNKAIVFFNKSLLFDDKNVEAYANRAYAYMLVNNLKKAFEDLQTAYGLDSRNIMVLQYRTIFYKRTKNYKELIANFSAIIGLLPDNSNAYFERGNVYLVLNKHDKACEDWRKALSLGDKNAEAYVNKYCK